MAEHPNADLIRRGYAAFSEGDLGTLSQLFAQDITWHSAGVTSPVSGAHKGQEAVFTMFGELVGLTGGTFKVELEEVFADDHQAVAVHRATGERNGQTYEGREVIVFHLLDGKVTDGYHIIADVEAADAFLS